MRNRIVFLAAAVLLTGGCASMIRPESPEPALYRLEYDAAPTACAHGFDRGVRVMPFSTAPTYNRTQMVVLGTGRQVIFSKNYQWVANPGTMLSGKLEEDLKAGKVFPQVASADELANVPLELGGQISEFACERTDSKCEAVLNVDVVLKETGLNRKTVFRKGYRLRSEPFDKKDSALFARAMSRIVKQFSEKLRMDLCEAAEK